MFALTFDSRISMTLVWPHPEPCFPMSGSSPSTPASSALLVAVKLVVTCAYRVVNWHRAWLKLQAEARSLQLTRCLRLLRSG